MCFSSNQHRMKQLIDGDKFPMKQYYIYGTEKKTVSGYRFNLIQFNFTVTNFDRASIKFDWKHIFNLQHAMKTSGRTP